jgi:hypothetical protein
VVDVALNIVPISLLFFGEFLHEMLIWIGIDSFDLVAWLLVAGVVRWIWGWLWVGIGGDDGAGGGVSRDWEVLKNFFQISMPIRKRANAMPIMAAGEVKVQWVSAGLTWLSSLNNSLKKLVLCITNAFTKYAVVTAIANKEAEMVADAIFKDRFAKFGIPAQIHPDGGKEFMNKLSAELFQLLNVCHTKTSPAHLQCNTQVEVFNKTVKRFLQ